MYLNVYSLNRARIYYIAGFFLTVSVESALFVGKHAAEHNKLFCLNLSAPFICQFFGEQLSSVLPYVDYLFCNESEALAYSTAKGYGEDLEQIALKIAAQPKACGTHPRVVVITNGAQATIVARNGVVNLYSVDPLPKELLIDTNGAGDAFVGGFLSRLALNSDIAECVRAAHFASRTIIQRSGCTFPADCEYV
jgi:adenosine kinase